MEKRIIPVFFAYNGENKEQITSLAEGFSKNESCEYKMHVLYKGNIEGFDELGALLIDVSELIKDDNYKLYKFAIPMVCEYEKAVYIDPSISVNTDIASLYDTDLKTQYVAGFHDTAFDGEVTSKYTESVLGISHHLYISDDVLILNAKKLKESKAYERFLLYYDFCEFKVSQSQALFNLTLKDHILIIGNVSSEVNEADALNEINDENSFLNKWNREKRAKDRVDIVKKIADFEKEGTFDQDVEDDVPGRMIMPDEIEYIKKTPIAKIKANIAFKMAKKFYYKLEKQRQVIVDHEIRGLENFKNLDTGAIITCNHFNAMDSFAMHWTYMQSKQKKRKLYRIIREGNYTSFPGFFGFLMRNFYTLPLSSNHKTMKKFMEATNTLLTTGHFVLVYPEQSMWWNYRKPKPLKPGAFSFATKNQVPVLPIFITMKDSDVLGADGYYVQEYTIHISEPIYPKPELNTRENTEYMLKENERVWKEIYEREYQMPLEYTTNTFEF